MLFATMRRLLILGVGFVFFVACATEEESGVVEPSSGTSTGYYQVRIQDVALDPASVVDVRFGGIRAYGIEPDGDGFYVTVQGHPEPGMVDLEVDTDAGTEMYPAAFEYLPPRDPAFARIAALGASLSQGVQNGVPTSHGALVSPPAQVAGQLGGYFPRPVFTEGLFPEMELADLGPPPECASPSIGSHLSKASAGLADIIINGFETGRQNPDIEVHNVAVGGAYLSEVLHGVSPDTLGGEFVPRLVYSPYKPLTQTQLEVIEELKPTLVMSVDLFGNDAIEPLFTGSTIDPQVATPVEEIRSDLSEIVQRLAATGAEVFIANLPRPSLLPLAAQKKRRMIAAAVAAAQEAGEDEEQAAIGAEQQADAAIMAMDDNAAEYNNVLAMQADQYDNVHVVDTSSLATDLEDGGIEVGETVLTATKLGGLTGIDSLHFTDTGYALLANIMIESINETLGTDAPQVDVASVLDSDKGSPQALREAGFDVSQCNP